MNYMVIVSVRNQTFYKVSSGGWDLGRQSTHRIRTRILVNNILKRLNLTFAIFTHFYGPLVFVEP